MSYMLNSNEEKIRKSKNNVRLKNTSNGITIVSLVVTIILLLVLSTVSIQALTHTGLFESASKAKLENKRGQISEWLNLKLVDQQANYPFGSAEQIIKATHEEVVQQKSELSQMGKDVTIGEVSTEEDLEAVDVYFYVTVDGDLYKVELKGSKFLDKTENLAPSIKIVSISNTSNSITVKVRTSKNEGGKLKYYIKKASDSDYKMIQELEDNTYTYEGLEQGIKYNIKIIAEAPNKKTAEAVGEQTTGKVIDLKEGDLEFTSEPRTWTNTDVKVTVKANIDTKGYQLLTSKNPDEGWSKATSQTFKTNGTIYAVLFDGVNYGASASRAILNIDKKKPEVTGIETTSSTISIKAKDEDSGIVEYAITTSKVEPKEFTSVTNTKEFSTTIEEQQQGTTYYVWIKDQAGNVSVPATATTGNVTDLKQADITITPSPSGWTNGKVVATAKVNVDIGNYKIRTSTDGEHWETKNSQTFSSNGTMYVALWDGTNYGASATQAINNIDTTKPIVTGATATTNKIAITATDEASGIIGYAVTTSNTAPSSFTDVASTKTFSKTVENQKQGTTYYVWVKDAAGNVSASKSTATGKVTDLTSANVKFAYSPSGWTNTDVTATASTTVTGFTLQTSKDGKTWNSTNTQTFTANGTVYARLWDGTNYGGSATGNFTNIDKTKPVVTGATATTNKIAITATDEASGIIGYAVTTSNTAPSSFTGVTNTKSLSVAPTGYRQGTTYYVWVKDQAGNVSASKSTATGKVTDLTAANVKFTYSPSGWTNKDVTATASTTVSGFTLQTSKDGSNWSSTATQTYSSNGTIYARLTDGINYGGSATGNFTNIDKTAPTVSTALKSTSTSINSVALSVGITDTNSGLGKIDWYYGTTNNPTTKAGTTSVTAMNTSATGPTTAQTKTYTVTGLSSGTTYYFKAIAYDVAGNQVSSTVISAKTANPTAGDISYTPSDSSWKVDNVKSALDALYSR